MKITENNSTQDISVLIGINNEKFEFHAYKKNQSLLESNHSQYGFDRVFTKLCSSQILKNVLKRACPEFWLQKYGINHYIIYLSSTSRIQNEKHKAQ